MSPFNDNRHTTLKGECVYDYKQFQQRASGYFRCITWFGVHWQHHRAASTLLERVLLFPWKSRHWWSVNGWVSAEKLRYSEWEYQCFQTAVWGKSRASQLAGISPLWKNQKLSYAVVQGFAVGWVFPSYNRRFHLASAESEQQARNYCQLRTYTKTHHQPSA